MAMNIAATTGASVVGVDLSEGMLRQGQRNVARAGLGSRVSLSLGRAESLPFRDGAFDAVCFTWLLRYVDDPAATVREVARVLKPGGTLHSLEFAVPDNMLARGLWQAYTRLAFPLATMGMSRGWRYVGRFLGPSITRFYQAYSLEDIREMWVDAGIPDVRIKRLSLGGGVVMWGTKTAT